MSPSMPRVSVITVCRNSERTIHETLASVAGQSYAGVEHVVIDGASTDATVAVVREFPHVATLVSEPDAGIYDAMNKGVAHARGEWILFMNSGDRFAEDRVLDRVFGELSRSDPVDVLYGSTIIKATGERVPPPAKVSKGFFFFETICHQSIFVRRELFDRVGPFRTSYRVIADREWLLLAMESGARFRPIDVTVSVWDPVGFSSANEERSRAENADLQHRYYSDLERAVLPWRMRALNLRRKISRAFGGKSG